MPISALSSNLVNDLSQQQNPFRQIRQDFNQLASALQSGDLSGAQSAFSNLQQLLQGRQTGSNASSNGPSTIQTDFAAVGQALQSGDLNQAQNIFSQLQKDLQAARQAPTAPPTDGDQYVPSSSQSGLSAVQQVQQDFAQLNSALQSGDLSGAQSAFAILQQALQSQGASAQGTAGTQSSASSGNATDPITNDFNALGQALASGNLSQAQETFSQLQNDIQTAQQAAGSPGQSLTQGLQAAVKGHHHHHHHGGGDADSQSSTSTTASTNSSTASNTSSSVNLYA
jgi:hypothetical protein